jgi:hypothetical protein
MTIKAMYAAADPAGNVPKFGERLRLFALQATADLGNGISQVMEHPLAVHEEREFEDG